MAHALRDRSTPRALAQGRQVIEFKGKIADFPRLSRIVARDLDALDEGDRPTDWRNAPLSARLAFGFADVSDRLPIVEGQASVVVTAVCQRCLDPVDLALTADLSYLLLPEATSGAGLDEYEVWELDEESFRPAELVEEALIMLLPISAVHEDPDDCGPLSGRLVAGTGRTRRESTRPFADLRSRMKDNT